MTKPRLLLALAISLILAFVLVDRSAGQSQQPPSIQAALTQALRQLSACQSQLGPLIGIQADMVAGTYTDWPTVKADLERTNPTLEFDLKTHLVSTKPTPTK